MVRSFRIVPQPAMPIAPPRLRIRLNRPEANFSRSGGITPRVSVTVGATANCWEKPRNACGINSSRQPQSWVIGVKFHMLKVKQARPNSISQRKSILRARKV